MEKAGRVLCLLSVPAQCLVSSSGTVCLTVAYHVSVLLHFISEHVALTFEEHESSGKSTQKCGHTQNWGLRAPAQAVASCPGRPAAPWKARGHHPACRALVPGHTPEKGQKRGASGVLKSILRRISKNCEHTIDSYLPSRGSLFILKIREIRGSPSTDGWKCVGSQTGIDVLLP